MLRALLCLCVLAHTCFSSADPLALPVSLDILNADLSPIAKLCSSGNISKYVSLKYADNAKFLVRCERRYDKPNVLVVKGSVTVASIDNEELKQLSTGPLYFHEHRFFYLHGSFGVEKTIAPIENHFVISYTPPEVAELEVDDVIRLEYEPLNSFSKQIAKSFRKLAYESKIATTKVIVTSFSMKNGEVLRISYNRTSNVAVFTGGLYSVEERGGRLVQSKRYSWLRYNISSGLCDQIQPGSGVYAMMAFSPSKEKTKNCLKLHRENLLTDLRTSRPRGDECTGAIGLINYGNGHVFTVEKYSTYMNNRLNLTRLHGEFMTPTGVIFQSVCLYEPNGSDSHKPAVFLSCDYFGETSYVLLQSQDDFVCIAPKGSVSLDVMWYRLASHAYKEPYIEYVSFEEFRDQMKIVINVLKNRCTEKSVPQISYKMYADVTLSFDCVSQTSSLASSSAEAEFESYSDDMVWDKGDFFLRQVYPYRPGTLPKEIEYWNGLYDLSYRRYLITDLRSLDDDMKVLRWNLLKSWMPSSIGAVVIDKEVLFSGSIIQEKNGGTKKLFLKVVSKVHLEECVEDCLIDYEIRHDGEKISDVLVYGEKMQSMALWPTNQQVKRFSHKISYVKVTTFWTDMKELSKELEIRCAKRKVIPGGKLSFFYTHLGSSNCAAGYYDCNLRYVSFNSDFKAIKMPKIVKESFYTNVLGKSAGELQAAEVNAFEHAVDDEKVVPEEKDMRKAFPDLIIKDLIYDAKGDIMNSRTMHLTEMYALKALTSVNFNYLKKGKQIKRNLSSGATAIIYE